MSNGEERLQLVFTEEELAAKLTEPGVTLKFHKDAAHVARDLGVTTEVVRGVLYGAARREVAPQSVDAGYLITRHRRGDVVLVVGHRDAPALVLLAVYVLTDQSSRTKYGRTANSSGPGSSLPTSYRELVAKIQARGGYRIEAGGNVQHPKVIAKDDGAFICSLSTTPGDGRTSANEWRTFTRRADEHEAARFPAAV